MKKKLLTILFLGLLLTSCSSAKNEPTDNKKPSTPDVVEPTTPKEEFGNEQIRVMLKNDYRYYKEETSNKTQFSLNGDVIAPDEGNTGMYNYRLGLDYKTGFISKESETPKKIDLPSIIDKIPGIGGNGNDTTLLPSAYLKISLDKYLMKDGVVSETPTSTQKLIRKTDITDVVDYEKNADDTYIKTIDRNGTLPFIALMTAIQTAIKEYKLDDFPVNAKYSYIKGGIYGIEFKFKDLEGTSLMENIDLIIGMFPELAEVFYEFKDAVIISISNLQLNVKNTTFDVAVKYPIGGFPIEAIKGSFKLKYICNAEDPSKFEISDTYYTAKQDTNTISTNMLKEEKQDNKTVYTTSLLLSSLTSLSIKDIEDIKKVINRRYQITCDSATKIEYFDRNTLEPIEVKDNQIDLSLLERVVIKLTFDTYTIKTLNIKDISIPTPKPDEGESEGESTLPGENL